MNFSSELACPGQAAAIDACDILRGHDPSTKFTCDVVDDMPGFAALRPEWDDLMQRCGRGSHVFMGFNWNWHWARNYLDAPKCNCELAILCLRAGGLLVGIWPLRVVHHAGVRVIHWMGEPVSQYGDVLIDPAYSTQRLLDYGWARAVALLRADAMHIRKVRADATTLPWLQMRRATLVQREEAPFLDLASAASFDLYEERYSSKARKNRRRLARRLAGLGDVRIEHVSAGPQARAAALEAVALKRRTLDETGRLSFALHDPRFATFFADAAEGASHPCDCRVTRMSVNGALVASTIDISFKTHRAAHIIVHEPEFAACGPGMLMVEEWARAAHADGMATLDLLAPGHAYKWDWADGSVTVDDYALALSLKGRLYVAFVARLRPQLKELAERYARWRSRQRPANRHDAA